MAKPIAKRRHDEAERAFRKAWKLLDRIEKRLERARAQERKRLTQLGDGTGKDAARRSAQLEAARAEIAQIEGLLTELSDLIATNARASSGQTVKDVAAIVAAEIKNEAAVPPVLGARRNRHHRPRRKPAAVAGADAADAAAGPGADTTTSAGPPSSDGSSPIALPPPLDVGSVDEPATDREAPAVPVATAPPKPAPVVYRSLVSQPPARRTSARPTLARPAPDPENRREGDAPDGSAPADEAGPTGEAAPTSPDGPTTEADRDDTPPEGA
jgi:hypothetical protein